MGNTIKRWQYDIMPSEGERDKRIGLCVCCQRGLKWREMGMGVWACVRGKY